MILNKDYNYYLIGGGKFLIDTAIELKKNKIYIEIFFSVRQFHDLKNDKVLISKLKKNKIKFFIFKNINKDSNIFKKLNKTKNIGLCFGSAWIFGDKFLKLFNYKIFNINCIPLPKYMGGAHFTWQILNNSKDGGIYLQQITKKLDQGPIYLSKKFKILKKNPIPLNYFENYDIYIKKFVKDLLFKIKNNIKLKKNNFENLFNMREYFPRLKTIDNGFINWSWKSSEIVKFCNAFDRPYKGASTYIDNKRVFLQKVSLFKKCSYHSFCNGIIIRKTKGTIFISTSGGIIAIGKCLNSKNELINNSCKQGDRFYTPSSKLDAATKKRAKVDAKGFN